MSDEAKAFFKLDMQAMDRVAATQGARAKDGTEGLLLCGACNTLVVPDEHKEGGQSCRMRAANRYGAKP